MHRLEPRHAVSKAAVILLLAVGLVAPSTASAPSAEAGSRPWVRKASVQGVYRGKAVRARCTWSDCGTLPGAFRVSLMVTPRGDGLQVYSLIGDHSVRLRWVPDSGGYVGRTVSSGSSIRAMRVVVTDQTRIEGAWTAQTLVAELRSWKPGPPRRGDAYRVELTRRSAGVDVAVVLDRTGSMTTADIRNVQDGAIGMLRAFDSRQIWVGLSVLPYGDAQDPCTPGNPQVYPSPGLDPWRMTSMSPYHSKPDGRLDPDSPIVQAIGCLRPSPTITVTVDGVDRSPAGHTNLGDPMAAAHAMLESEGRDDAADVIMFMTDGEASQPDGMLPCRYFNRFATEAKRSGQVIFTIAYGVGGARCQRDTGGRFRNAFASTNLAAAATRSTDDLPGACSRDENGDGDHYFCEPHGDSLKSTFRQVAAAALETPSRRPCRRGCW